MKIGKQMFLELPGRAKETVCRFPLVTFFLCIGAVNHLYMSIFQPKGFEHASRNIFMCLLLLVPVLYSIRILRETGGAGKLTSYIMQGVAFVAALLYCYYLPDRPLNPFYISQFTILFIASILCSFVCVKQGAHDDEFYWYFYVELLIRGLITCIYTVIIIGGTTAALGAIDILFKIDLLVNEVRVCIVTLWIFAPLFFLAGVPCVSAAQRIKRRELTWLKNLGAYVMVPLTVVYLGILYAYGAMILFRWELPKGTIAYLVLSFAAFGIISLLVIFPFRNDSRTVWINRFSRSFYYLQLPLLILLFVGIFTRVFAYGITFTRYYVLALAVWILFLTAFMIVRKGRNLFVIPLSLLVLAVVSILGPWSAFNVSFRDQKSRLMQILEANHLIQGGKVIVPEMPPPRKVQEEISSILMYLDDYGKIQSLAPLLSSGGTPTPKSLAQQMGFTCSGPYSRRGQSFFYHCGNVCLVFQPGDCLAYVRFNENLNGRNKEIKKARSGDFLVEFFPETCTFQFNEGEARTSRLDLRQIAEHFKALGSQNIKDRCDYIFRDENFEIHCLLNTLAGWEDSGEMHFGAVQVDFIIKRR